MGGRQPRGLINPHGFFVGSDILFSFSMRRPMLRDRRSFSSPVRLPAPCTPASHATLGWTYSPFERLETREGLGSVAIELRSRESGIFGFAIDCVRPKIRYLCGEFDFHRLNERYKVREMNRSSQQRSILEKARASIVISIKNQVRDESPDHGLVVGVRTNKSPYL